MEFCLLESFVGFSPFFLLDLAVRPTLQNAAAWGYWKLAPANEPELKCVRASSPLRAKCYCFSFGAHSTHDILDAHM